MDQLALNQKRKEIAQAKGKASKNTEVPDDLRMKVTRSQDEPKEDLKPQTRQRIRRGVEAEAGGEGGEARGAGGAGEAGEGGEAGAGGAGVQ